jgi:VWFA-related protein
MGRIPSKGRVGFLWSRTSYWRALVVLTFCYGVVSKIEPQTQQPHYKTTVNFIRITAVVRDLRGQPIRNLQANDFSVTDKERPQSISYFLQVEHGIAKQRTHPPSGTNINSVQVVPPHAAQPPAEANAGAFGYLIIAFDAMGNWFQEDSGPKLTAGFASRYFAVRAARKFLKSSNLRAYQVAVLGPHGLIQNFTQDRRQLLRALDQVSQGLPNPPASLLLTAGYDLLQQLKTVPGRKSMVIFTDFRANGQDAGSLLFPCSGDSLPAAAFGAPERFVTAAIDASVAIYPVDSRGVVAVIPFGDATTPEIPTGGANEAAQSVASQISAQNSELASTNGLLESVAWQTGGRAVAHSNALEQIFKLLVEDSESYYVLSYYNRQLIADGRFHRISVRANCTCTVQAKAGYFAR